MPNIIEMSIGMSTFALLLPSCKLYVVIIVSSDGDDHAEED